MNTFCRIAPEEGQGYSLFSLLKEKYDADTAWDLVSLCHLESFKKGKSFRLDSEGFPLMEDLLKDKLVLKLIGDSAKINFLAKKFPEMQNNRKNYYYMVLLAGQFNSSNNDYIAIVELTDNDTLKVSIRHRTPTNERMAKDLYGTVSLNSRIAQLLQGSEITLDDIVEAEAKAGRVGVTDFTKAMNIANSTVSVIRIANNKEGAEALSEEFSHLIIGAYRNKPLIKRALAALSDEKILKEVLGDLYQDTYDFHDGDLDMIAEEALGQLLRENLIAEHTNNPERINSILNRLYDNIKSKFRGIDESLVREAIVEANNLMGLLAKNILNKEIVLGKEDIKNSARAAQFNALSDRINANILILKNLKDVEVKRFRISLYRDTLSGRELKLELLDFINSLTSMISRPELDTREGIYKYALHAIEELKAIEASLNRNPSFGNIRRARTYTLSYAKFINDMHLAIIDAESDEEVPKYLTDIQLANGTIISITDIIKDLNDLLSSIVTRYHKITLSKLEEFFRPFYGDDIIIAAGKSKGTKLRLSDIIKEALSDISFTDMWLDSMAMSSDVYLQLFDRVAKAANDKARETTIDDSKRIDKLLKYALENGITNFEWMFEHYSNGKKNGNYISRLDFAKFEEAKEAFKKSLDEKYGEVATGENARAKTREYRQWLSDNADPKNPDAPKDVEKWHNREFMDMVELDGPRKKFYDEYMSIKFEADRLYPANRVAANKAILMRKTGGNRLLEAIAHPSRMIDLIKGNIKETFLDSEDDDLRFGSTKSGLTNFDNTEYMALPVLYTNRLKDPNEISTDVIAALLTYKYSANVFHEMDKIVDPLEVARFWATSPQGRKVMKTRGDSLLEEKIEAAGQKVTNKILETNTNIEAKIKEFMESNIYQRYMKDEGTLAGINVSKAGNWLLKASSLAQLGFNFLANAANVATGIAMINIEAAAGEYFDARELAAADSAYFGMLKDFLPELGSRVKTSKLHLFDELFNIKLEYGGNVKRNQMKNILLKLFGALIAYLGLDAGDHWLYNRVAIAICKRLQVRVPKNYNLVSPVDSYEKAMKALEKIIDNADDMMLTLDEKFYKSKLRGNLWSRVTSIISAGHEDAFSDTHSDGRPNNWKTPATNIGTGIDELVRDFFLGLLFKDDKGIWHHDNLGDDITKIYPNMTIKLIDNFLGLLLLLKQYFDENGLTVTSRDVVARGTIRVKDGNKVKDLRVAGTLDLLVHDKQGNFYIYDMKTHRGKIYDSTKEKWSRQLSLYKKLLEQEYGIKIKGLNIIPIKVTYPTPEGETSGGEKGTAKYEVKDGNQLLCNGSLYLGANPELESTIELSESKIDINYGDLGENLLNTTNVESDNTEIMSLWDALQVLNVYEDRDDIKKLAVPEGTLMEDGTALDLGLISRQISEVCIDLFGAYNQEDANAANRVFLGRALLQYRKWIKPQFNRRFQKALPSLISGKTKEGYYRTFGRLLSELYKGLVTLATWKDELSEEEYRNVRRAITEIIQFLAVLAIANFAPWPDDKERPWAVKFAEYMAKREVHELGMLIPSPIMLLEITKTVSSPLSVTSSVKNTLNLAMSICDPRDWVDEKQSGPYKGMSTLEVNFIKAPLPISAQYKQMDRFLTGIDDATKFFARPN